MQQGGGLPVSSPSSRLKRRAQRRGSYSPLPSPLPPSVTPLPAMVHRNSTNCASPLPNPCRQFGLVTREREPKPALPAVAEAYARLPFPPDLPWPSVTLAVCTHNNAATLADTCEALAMVRSRGRHLRCSSAQAWLKRAPSTISRPAPNLQGRLLVIHTIPMHLRLFLHHLSPAAGLPAGQLEVVFVDDGSTDATPGLLVACQQRVPASGILTLEHNCGLSCARNAALNASTAEVVAYTGGWVGACVACRGGQVVSRPGQAAAGGGLGHRPVPAGLPAAGPPCLSFQAIHTIAHPCRPLPPRWGRPARPPLAALPGPALHGAPGQRHMGSRGRAQPGAAGLWHSRRQPGIRAGWGGRARVGGVVSEPAGPSPSARPSLCASTRGSTEAGAWGRAPTRPATAAVDTLAWLHSIIGLLAYSLTRLLMATARRPCPLPRRRRRPRAA